MDLASLRFEALQEETRDMLNGAERFGVLP